MGVHGLWKLIEPAGKPVPLETLENKVLAVDISIWLHQAVKGFQDSRGAPVPNAHLLGVYHRLCKLLYFKIKPIFVFDGGVPVLKKETIAKRNQLKSRNTSEADRLQKQLLSTLLQHTAISKVLSEKTKASITAHTKKTTKHDKLYVLPTPEAMDSTFSSSSEEEEEETEESMSDSPTKQWDIHTIDTKSEQFKALPLETRHEILTELKETRKQSSWGRLHELPKQSDDFATYQMKRLLNRQAVQAALDEAAQEMGGSSLSLTQLESLLKDQGIPTVMNETVGKRIVSDPNKRYLYIKDVKEAIEKAKQNEEKQKEEVQKEETAKEHKITTKADLEEEEELQRAIALSLQEVPSTSDSYNEFEISLAETFREIEQSSDEDFEEVPVKKTLSSAQSYMMEYTGLTPYEIEKILGEKGKMPIGNKGLMKEVKSTMKKGASSQHVETTTKAEGKKKLEIIEEISAEEDEKTREPLRNIREIIEVSKEKEEIVDAKENEEVSNKIVQDAITTNRKFVYEKEIDSTEEGQNVNGEQISEMDKYEAESTGIISEGDSTSSEEFIEINSHLDTKKKESLKLVINPIENVDDLFSDIFEDKKDVEKLEDILKAATEKEKLKTNRIEDGEFSKKTKINDEVEMEEREDFEQLETVLRIAPKQDTIEVNLFKNAGIKTKQMEKNLKKQDAITEESRFDLSEKQQGEIIRNEVNEKDGVRNNVVEEVKSDKSERPKLSIEEMEMMQSNLLQDRIDLLIEKSTKERMATNITDQMYQEAQELLEFFGVPYVIAPMEAEAQCAFLDEIELTDGTITDDSDIWLFGGRTVYKNFFNPTKYVLEYKAENIKHHFKLSREQMILLALLVGSDYTIGIQGVGPVTALEILAAFPPSESNDFYLTHNQLVSGLREFKSWFYKGQSGGLGRSVLKSKLKNINFSDNFPSLQVVRAYLEPKVNPSREKFSWGKPDIINLSLFAKEKFGWSSKKIDEILNPVIKRIEEKQIQRSIKDFFKTKFSIPSGNVEVKSKRVKTAIERMGKTSEELIAEEMQTLEKEKKKIAKSKSGKPEKEKKRKKDTKTEIQNSNDDAKKDVQDNGNNESQNPKKRTKKTKNEDMDDDCKDNTESSKNKRSTIIENINDIENTQIDEDGPKKKRSRKSTNDDSKEPLKKPTRKKPSTKTSGNSQSESEYFQFTGPNQSRKRKLSEETSRETKPKARKKPESITKKIEETTAEKLSAEEELGLYENVAIELKMRRQRKLELTKVKLEEQKLQKRIIDQSKSQQDAIPESLQQDEEVQLLLATTSNSTQRNEKIKQQVQKQMEKEKNKQLTSKLHQKDVIHQKLRDQSSVLRNKLKAIEVFRKSKKGPGYVPKRTKTRQAPKDDAELSEDSGNE